MCSSVSGQDSGLWRQHYQGGKFGDSRFYRDSRAEAKPFFQ